MKDLTNYPQYIDFETNSLLHTVNSLVILMSTILVVDDNRINLKLIVAHLMRMGHFVVAAENGVEAVALFKKNEFDIIFMDYQMPLMDGKEAVTIIRELEKNRNTTHRTPIISVSANLNDELKVLLIEAGVDGFISKPITKSVLEKHIQHINI